jgi:NADH:ubiquinone oxidoreductase subunit 2 (subunit N)
MSLVIIGLIVSTLILMVQGGKEARELGVMSLVVGLSLESNNVAQIIMISGIVVLIVGEQDMETVVLGVMGIIGLIIVGTTTGLLTMYLGIEIVGLSFYILAGRERKGAKSTEAGMKYFVLGAISSGILLMGITKVYAETGTTDIELIGTVSKTMVEVGILFKVGAAPFHM